jgi:hypothetical protein
MGLVVRSPQADSWQGEILRCENQESQPFRALFAHYRCILHSWNGYFSSPDFPQALRLTHFIGNDCILPSTVPPENLRDEKYRGDEDQA